MRKLGLVTSAGLLAGTLGITAAVTASGAAAPGAPSQGESSALWQAGSCYRVFQIGDQNFVVFKVLSTPAGGWVRVEPDPSFPTWPGAKPRQRLWINAGAVFAVQEWECWDAP